MKTRLLFRAELEALNLQLQPNCYFQLKGHCSNCQEQLVLFASLDETFPIPGSRGEAHAVMKCHLCERSVHLNIISQSSETYEQEQCEKFFEVARFECRGLELDSWVLSKGEFKGVGAQSNVAFDEISLEEGEWYDYDEEAQCSVSVINMEQKFEAFKE